MYGSGVRKLASCSNERSRPNRLWTVAERRRHLSPALQCWERPQHSCESREGRHMGHSYTCNRVHIVFSTRHRKDLITSSNQCLLWAYLAGIGKNFGAQVLKIGGTANHVHALIGLPAT